jgi:phosphoribosyl-ATP pyrophosphohydrolase/phosphoribosyl-AMP cyclohydrolase
VDKTPLFINTLDRSIEIIMASSSSAFTFSSSSLRRAANVSTSGSRFSCSKKRASSSSSSFVLSRQIRAAAGGGEPLTKESDIAPETPAMKQFLDGLKYDANGLVTAIAQDVDTGAILMQGFASRSAVAYTLQHKKACFFSRSRQQLWCKGESSSNFINVDSVHVDCDKDSLIYLGVPTGPTCHTGAHTCYYKRVDGDDGLILGENDGRHKAEEALTTLYELEATIAERKREVIKEGTKPSWTRRLLEDPELLCSKIREEAGELCETYEKDEGKERAASECADVLYHAMVLLNVQGVEIADVMEVLRNRFGVSGVEEKAKRTPKSKLIDPSKK